VLADARAVQRRLRLLPSRVGVYFVLGLGLFPGAGYLGVWEQLTAALDGLGLAVPSARALRDLRRRLGAVPLQAMFEALAGPTAWPRTPGVRFGRFRTVSFDGCKTIKVPDTPRNRAWLGKMNAAPGETGYPVIHLMTLVETGTRALIGAVFGSVAEGEITWARKLLHLLDATMLVLMDRGFDGGEFLREVAATRAQFLVRLTCVRRPPALRNLPDGSVLSLTGGVKVRIITATVTVTCHDGTTYGDSYRLATTLLDHRAYPPGALITLYHERWQHEITYLALRHTLLHGRVLRSGDPAGLQQEMRALLTLCHHRPGRDHRPRRPGPPAPAPPAPRLRPKDQIPAITLEQAPARQAPEQPEDHQRDRRRQPVPGRKEDTPPTVLDPRARTLSPRHWD
jgi:hypothetical protein